MQRKEPKENYHIISSSGVKPPKEDYNYNSAGAPARTYACEALPPVNIADDPVEIAVRAFHATATNRKLWRWYHNMMQLLEPSHDRADELFCAWVYDTQREIAADGVPASKPGMDNLHARIFHNHLRDWFTAHYGRVTCPWHHSKS